MLNNSESGSAEILSEWLTQNGLAKYLHISRMSVWRLRQRPEFPSFKKLSIREGGRGVLLVRRKDVDAYLVEQAPAA